MALQSTLPVTGPLIAGELTNEMQHGIDEPAVTFIRFANGLIPVKRIDFTLDSFWSGSTPQSFEAGLQPNSFYIREGNVLSGRVPTNCVWGQSASIPWIVRDGVKYLSFTSPSDKGGPDPVSHEVELFRGAAEFATSLCLCPPFVRGSLALVSPTQISGNTRSFGVSTAQFTRDERSRINSIQLESQNLKGKLSTTWTYSYDDSDNSAWLPARIIIHRHEANAILHKDYDQSSTNVISFCEVGATESEEAGYQPEQFLQKPISAVRASIFSNGVNMLINGTNITFARPAKAHSGGLYFTRRRRIVRGIVTAGIVLTAAVILWRLISAERKHKTNRKAEVNE